jgi:hypothetical protein
MADRPLLDLVYQHFKDRPDDFEQFAADLWRVSEPNVDKIDVTRPWRDGGRDAIGKTCLVPMPTPLPSSSPWRPSARAHQQRRRERDKPTHLAAPAPPIRRPGHYPLPRYQAYREIREDGHPVVVLAGRDVIERLKDRGLDNITAIRQHLHDAYPPHE